MGGCMGWSVGSVGGVVVTCVLVQPTVFFSGFNQQPSRYSTVFLSGSV